MDSRAEVETLETVTAEWDREAQDLEDRRDVRIQRLQTLIDLDLADTENHRRALDARYNLRFAPFIAEIQESERLSLAAQSDSPIPQRQAETVGDQNLETFGGPVQAPVRRTDGSENVDYSEFIDVDFSSTQAEGSVESGLNVFMGVLTGTNNEEQHIGRGGAYENGRTIAEAPPALSSGVPSTAQGSDLHDGSPVTVAQGMPLAFSSQFDELYRMTGLHAAPRPLVGMFNAREVHDAPLPYQPPRSGSSTPVRSEDNINSSTAMEGLINSGNSGSDSPTRHVSQRTLNYSSMADLQHANRLRTRQAENQNNPPTAMPPSRRAQGALPMPEIGNRRPTTTRAEQRRPALMPSQNFSRLRENEDSLQNMRRLQQVERPGPSRIGTPRAVSVPSRRRGSEDIFGDNRPEILTYDTPNRVPHPWELATSNNRPNNPNRFGYRREPVPSIYGPYAGLDSDHSGRIAPGPVSSAATRPRMPPRSREAINPSHLRPDEFESLVRARSPSPYIFTAAPANDIAASASPSPRVLPETSAPVRPTEIATINTEPSNSNTSRPAPVRGTSSADSLLTHSGGPISGPAPDGYPRQQYD